jgi:hypothetical protein
MSDAPVVTKRLTFIFDDDSPLADIARTALVDGLYLDSIPQFVLDDRSDISVAMLHPNFAGFFRDHLCRVTLNIDYNGKSDLNYEASNSEEVMAKSKATHWCIAAMLYTPRFMAPSAAIVTVPSEPRVCHSHEMLQYGYVAEPGEARHPNRKLASEDLTAINALYPTVRGVLAAGSNGGLVTAIKYYQQAFHLDVDLNIRFLSMIMGLECLFGNVFTEISHQVSERVACYIEADGDERLALYTAMKKHYSLRSKIAHGRHKTEDQTKVVEQFPQVLRVLRNAIVKTLSDPRLIQLFDSKPDVLNAALYRLVFYGSLDKWLADQASAEFA